MLMAKFMGVGIPALGLVAACLIFRNNWWVAAILVALSCYQLVLVSSNDAILARNFRAGNRSLEASYYVQLMITVTLMANGDYEARRDKYLTNSGVAFAYVFGCVAMIANAIFLAMYLPIFFGK